VVMSKVEKEQADDRRKQLQYSLSWKPLDPNENEFERVVTGYKKFRKELQRNPAKQAYYRELVEKGQSPKVMVISCSDSRVEASKILGCGPGQMFAVRSVANLVPRCQHDHHSSQQPGLHGTSAAIEYAVTALKVHHIILMGHTHCGGIKALMMSTGTELHISDGASGFVNKWMEIAKDARDYVVKHHGDLTFDAQLRKCEEKALTISLENLLSFPWLKERVEANKLRLHAWLFDITSGEINVYDRNSSSFHPLVKEGNNNKEAEDGEDEEEEEEESIV